MDGFEPEYEDILAGVVDPDGVRLEVPGDDEADAETAAVHRVLGLIDRAYAEGRRNTRIPCPFCGQPLRYRKEEHVTFAECPAGDFVCVA